MSSKNLPVCSGWESIWSSWAYVVMRTESATFPLDMYVATFDAWPPGQHETKIRPVARGAESFRVWKS